MSSQTKHGIGLVLLVLAAAALAAGIVAAAEGDVGKAGGAAVGAFVLAGIGLWLRGQR